MAFDFEGEIKKLTENIQKLYQVAQKLQSDLQQTGVLINQQQGALAALRKAAEGSGVAVSVPEPAAPQAKRRGRPPGRGNKVPSGKSNGAATPTHFEAPVEEPVAVEA